MDLLRSFGVTDIFGHMGVDRFVSKKDLTAAYKKKAMTLHPDKTNGKTEVQFKILVLCYKECLKNVVDGEPVLTHSELKSAERQDTVYARDFYSTNFDDPKTREQIFVDDDLEFEKFQEAMKKTQSGSTTYSTDNVYNKSIYEKLKTNGKFDREKFNAYFLKLKKDGKIGKELMKVEKVVPYSVSTFMEVNRHDDMIINLDPHKRKGNYIDLMKSGEIKPDDIKDLANMDDTTLKKLTREAKINTGKLSKKKIKEAIESRRDIPVDSKYSFSEGISRLEQDAINRMDLEKEKQREVVNKYKHVYNLRLDAPPPRR